MDAVEPVEPVTASAGAHDPIAADVHHPTREFVAVALYIDFVFLAGLAVVPTDHLPQGKDAALVILGASLGLLAGHWLSFRLAVQVTTDGHWHDGAREAVVAQMVGGLGVAFVGAVPFLVLSGPTAVRTSILLLAVPPAAAGLVIGRLRGHSWPVSVAMALLALVAATGVVLLKAHVGH